jgi:multifunctional methyltransferase subunit TRM112
VVEVSPVDREMLIRLLPKVDYGALRQAAQQVAACPQEDPIEIPDLPEELPETLDDVVVSVLHKVLFDIHVEEGALICPDTGRRFPVKQGIPNMILHEDEI